MKKNYKNVCKRNSLLTSLVMFLLCNVVLTGSFAAGKTIPPAHSHAENGMGILHDEQDVIYACPMHPEITANEPGKCSICGMFLVAQQAHDDGHGDLHHAYDAEVEQAPGDELDENIIYACPMHPEEISDEPGKCSICGMFLVKEILDDDNMDEEELSDDMSSMQKYGKQGLFWENSNLEAMVTPQHNHNHDQNKPPTTKRLKPGLTTTSSNNKQHGHDQHSPVQPKENLLVEDSKITYICPMHPRIIQHEPGGSCPICGMDLVAREKVASTEAYPQVYLEAAVIQNMGVRIAKVESRPIQKSIRTQGLINADEDRLLSIHSRAGGWVEKLYLLTEGDRVERKDILLDFYSPWINQAQLKYIHALGEFDQLAFDPDKKVEVGAKLDAARNSLRLLNVMDMDIMRIRNNRKVLNTLQMLSPQGGIITDLNISEGMYVEPYTSMFTIVDLKQVWVMVDIYEHQAPWVRKGSKVEIAAPAIPARSWHGVVDFIYPEVDPKTRTLRARIVVPNPDEALLLNMFVKVDINADAKKRAVLTVPREAVIITGERETVIKSLGNGHFQPVDVKTGLRGEGSVEILSGLQQGDEIVVSGQFLIDSESSLQASFLRMSE